MAGLDISTVVSDDDNDGDFGGVSGVDIDENERMSFGTLYEMSGKVRWTMTNLTRRRRRLCQKNRQARTVYLWYLY